MAVRHAACMGMRPKGVTMSGPGLFIVCGDEERRKSFAGALLQAGWRTVRSASSMAEASGMIRNAAKACAIVDAELGDMPGLQAVQILRQLCPQVRIIFTTPRNTGDLEAQVRALDVFYYYISSTDRAELVAAVADAIGSPRPAGTGRSPKVLIVDDDPAFHATVRAILESAGYGVVSAYSEPEGLAPARREAPDAILLDIIMESTTDGFEFCREAKRDPKIKHTPILGISAIDERIGLRCPPDCEPGLFPVNGYLRKPVAAEQLLSELHRLIPGRDRRWEATEKTG